MRTLLFQLLFIACLAGILFTCKEKVERTPPTFAPVSVTGVGVNSAELTSAITKSGNEQILDHGFTLSQSEDQPAIDDHNIKLGAIDRATPTPIAFNGSLAGLQTATDYYVLAFAMLESGPVFSEAVKFRTSNVVQPAVKTEGHESVAFNSARLRGAIVGKGSYAISEYGIVWGGGANPTTASASKFSVKEDATSLPHSFSTDATGLAPGTTYHYRAYVLSNGVTTYGADLTFRTLNEVQPVVETGEAKPGDRSAYLTGQITAKGSSAISQYGVCWSTAADPTVSGDKFVHSGDVADVPKIFDGTAGNLAPGITYHYRAFVTMNGVTTYGADKTFATGTVGPHIITNPATVITINSAVLNANIGSAGSHPVTEIGIVWSRTVTNPVLDGSSKASKSTAGINFPHDFSFTASNLVTGSVYYFRAYAIANGVVYYGNSRSFSTQAVVMPTVSTSTTFTKDNGRQEYIVNGGVTKQGTYPVARYGFEYSIGSTGFSSASAQQVSLTPTSPRASTFSFSDGIPMHRCLYLYYRAFVVDTKGNKVVGEVRSINAGPCIN